MESKHSVPAGLLNEKDLEVLKSGFARAYPVSQDDEFAELLMAIDRADAEHRAG